MDCKISGEFGRVVGDGNTGSKRLIVGEAPGKDEVLQGVPFVGKAGKLLEAALRAANMTREDFYITNILHCRPTTTSVHNNVVNRTPEPDEIKACLKHLDVIIKIVNPKIILCIGAVAAQELIRPQFRITSERGKVLQGIRYNIPVMATIHPAYICRKQDDKNLYNTLCKNLVLDLKTFRDYDTTTT